jgi:orotate phosphoribosyltransferase
MHKKGAIVSGNVQSRKIIDLFLTGNALRKGRFYTTAGESSYYVNVDFLWSCPDLLSELTRILTRHLKKFLKAYSFDAIIGTDDLLDTFGALPIAVCICYELHKPLIIWKEYKVRFHSLFGMSQQVKNAIVFHDVCVGGEAIVNAARAARQNGIEVTEAFALVDWHKGGSKMLKKAGITLHSYISIDQLVEAYERASTTRK